MGRDRRLYRLEADLGADIDRLAVAAVILERRSVFVSASAIEITDDAIALLDETLGSGAD